MASDKYTLDGEGQPRVSKKAKSLFMTLTAAMSVLATGSVDGRKVKLMGYVERQHKQGGGAGAKSTCKIGRIADDSEELDDEVFASQKEVDQYQKDFDREQLEKEREDFEREKQEFYAKQRDFKQIKEEEKRNEENANIMPLPTDTNAAQRVIDPNPVVDPNPVAPAQTVNIPTNPPVPAPPKPAAPAAPKAPAKPAAPKVDADKK